MATVMLVNPGNKRTYQCPPKSYTAGLRQVLEATITAQSVQPQVEIPEEGREKKSLGRTNLMTATTLLTTFPHTHPSTPPPTPIPTVDYFEKLCAISKVPMALIKENIYYYDIIGFISRFLLSLIK